MSTSESDIRFAAETIYHSANVYQEHQYPISNMYRPNNHLDLINLLTEDYLAGYTQDGRMSVVRRFFCLFVIFDLFFISLLWLICIMLNGDTIYNALKVQVLHYSISSSLFDIVVIALFRCLILVLFYAILYTNHWFVICLTTTGSCAFLISKVFYYNWVASPQPVFQVLLIVVSCVLAWGEAWFLDCRVIPQEKNAQRFFRALTSDQDERSPLLGHYINSYHSARFRANESSIGNFYSPIDSAHNSDIEDEQDDVYINTGLESIRKAVEILDSTDWKLERTTKAGDKIQSVQRESYGKIYRLTGEVKYPAKKLIDKLVTGVAEISMWNPTVIESRVLRKIDAHTDITYQASAPGGAGIVKVKSRDFVNLRCWQVLSEGRIIPDEENTIVDLNFTDYSLLRTEPAVLPSKTSQTMHKSFSEIHIQDNVTEDNKSIATLSKSLGAKSFSGEIIGAIQNDEDDEEDAFADAEDKEPSSAKVESTDIDKLYLISAVSIEYDRMPPVEKFIRGENLVACYATRELKGSPGVCVFDWLLCLDLKGSLPRYVLEKALTSVMQDFMLYLRNYCDDLADGQSECCNSTEARRNI